VIKRNRLTVLMVSALLGVGALSGCEKNDDAASDAPSEATQDAAQDDTEADAEPEDTEPQDADDTPEPVDDVDTEDPDPADSQDDPADAAVEFLPTTLCPVDVPAPPIPHHMDSEEEGDGAEIYCIAYVSSKGYPETLYPDIVDQFASLGADILQDSPAAVADDPNDISIQSWDYEGHEVIVNMTYAGPTGVDLVYVVRSLDRQS